MQSAFLNGKVVRRVKMQAIIILAHKDIPQVIRLSALLSQRFKIYIHFDKKVVLSSTNKQQLNSLKVNYFSLVNVNWGSWSIGEAALLSMQKVLEDPQIDYIHIISGQDWPLKNLKDIYDFYDHNSSIYMSYSASKDHKKSGESLVNWQKYYFNYDKINRRSLYGKIYHRFNILIQSLLRVNKFKKYNFDLKLYNGANWMDLPIDVVKFLVDYANTHPNIMYIFKTGFCSDEFWVQTILLNSPQFNKRIINNNYRFVKWQKQHNSYPAILDDSDYEAVKKSNAFFGRKFDFKYSKSLIKKLNVQND